MAIEIEYRKFKFGVHVLVSATIVWVTVICLIIQQTWVVITG